MSQGLSAEVFSQIVNDSREIEDLVQSIPVGDRVESFRRILRLVYEDGKFVERYGVCPMTNKLGDVIAERVSEYEAGLSRLVPQTQSPTWEEKFLLLGKLTRTYLKCLYPGQWHVSGEGREKQSGLRVIVDFGGYGKTPQEAIEDDWRKMTEMSDDSAIRINIWYEHSRRLHRYYRWDGTSFEEIAPLPGWDD